VLTELSFKFDELRELIPRDEPGKDLPAFDRLEHVGNRRNVCHRPVRFMCLAMPSISRDEAKRN
jgi:hypothetical protein